MDNSTSIHIYECQKKINEFQEMKKLVSESVSENVRFLIETKHWYGYGLAPEIGKKKSDLDFSKETILALLDTAISVERKKINIQMEIEIRSREKHNAKLGGE